MSFVITDTNREFFLTRGECLELELSLNVSSNKFNYKYIGDQLYNYYCKPIKYDDLIITSEQYDFLLLLKSQKSWKKCYNL
jgi:hypothetical protein